LEDVHKNMPETTLAAQSDSKFGRRLQWFIGAIAIVFLWRLALVEDLTWMGWGIACAIIVLLTVTRWPYGALVVLIGMSTMARFFVEISGWKARPEHFAVVVVFLAVCIWGLRSKQKLRLGAPDYWVLAYVAINYVSSTFGSSSRSDTLRWALLNSLAVLPYFLIRFLVRDAETLQKTFRILVTIGIMESVYGILCYASHHIFNTTAGVEVGQYLTDVAGLYGSLAEANLFGAYSGCVAVLALAMYLVGGRRLGYLLCFFIGSIALVLSLSRAALVAAVLAAGWVCWWARRVRERQPRRTAALIAAVAVILSIVVPTTGDVLQERFADMFSEGRLGEQTTIGRLIEAHEALQEFSEHRLIGSGTASLQLYFDWSKYVPGMRDSVSWVGNITIRILHDTGLVGLAIVLGLLGSLWWKVRRVLRERSGAAPMLVALSAGMLLYAISFQATDGTLLAFPWIHLGFLSSAALLAQSTDENAHVGRSMLEKPA
jgi:O-antigen ligase